MASAILLLVALFAQFPSAVPQPQPDSPIRLTLRLTDGRLQFRPGEIIPIELEFSSATQKRFTVDGATYDRSGRLTIDEFVIDRIDDVSDPMLDYFGSIGGYIGGGIRGMGVLGEKPFTVKLELNEWFRFDKPGRYTLAVKSRRVTDESVTPHAVVPVESNTVSFEILPRDATWEASELESARRIIDAKQPPLGARAGCRMMRFLGTEAAAMRNDPPLRRGHRSRMRLRLHGRPVQRGRPGGSRAGDGRRPSRGGSGGDRQLPAHVVNAVRLPPASRIPAGADARDEGTTRRWR